MHVLVDALVIMLVIATFGVSSWTRTGGFNKWLRKRRAAAGKPDTWFTRPIYPPLKDQPEDDEQRR